MTTKDKIYKIVALAYFEAWEYGHTAPKTVTDEEQEEYNRDGEKDVTKTTDKIMNVIHDAIGKG